MRKTMKGVIKMKTKVRSLAHKALWGLLILQILVGVFSFFTLNIGRGIAVFGSAALIYLGLIIVQQLSAIRELLSYAAVQNVRPSARESSTSREPTTKTGESPARGRVSVRGNEDLA
jgi:hypothetical protein